MVQLGILGPQSKSEFLRLAESFRETWSAVVAGPFLAAMGEPRDDSNDNLTFTERPRVRNRLFPVEIQSGGVNRNLPDREGMWQ